MEQKTKTLLLIATLGLVCIATSVSWSLRQISRGSMLDGAQWARLKSAQFADINEISLPGYAIPVETQGQKAHQFILIPYLPSCVHLPPPLADQKVLVQSALPLNFSDAPIIVRGALKKLPIERLGCAFEISVQGIRPWSRGQFLPAEEN